MFDRKLVGGLYQKSGVFCPEYVWLLNHLTGVTHVAGFLSRRLNQKQNIEIDTELVEAAAMLHDIGKLFDNSPQGHVIEGVKFLSSQAVDKKIIQIVQRHEVYSFESGEISEPSTWEEKLVFLADLSFGNHIVSTKERVKDIIRRYKDSGGIPRGREKWLEEKSQEVYRQVLEIISPQTLPF